MRPPSGPRPAARWACWARWLWGDTRDTVRGWRPPERAEQTREAPHGRPPRAAEPTWGRSEAARLVRRGLQRRALFPALTALGRPEVTGSGHLDAVKPPLILAPNHASHADAPMVLQALPAGIREHTVVPAAADYFFERGWLRVGVTLAINAVPFDRRHDIADSVRRCERLLRHGHSVVLFPEGTRSADGRLRGFKAGVAHLAVGTGAPVVPVFVQGTHALLPRGRAIPRPTAVAVHFGEPLRAAAGESARQFNERLEAAVSELAASSAGYAHRDRVAEAPSWRALWRRGAIRPANGAAEVAPGWVARWRSTTPR